ncbi:UPF0462 protein C4orf33 homolog [Mya arenaria]|uniref:UPF0462 protein C4orf33 homolog n=1 Tax=Mya arenaria TaxID=6604 RepID=UPI0022E7F97C|nr:UPF0462 protein C4orf33 homolog [Mya arenaria]
MAKYLNTIAYMGFLVLMSVGMKTVIGQVTGQATGPLSVADIMALRHKSRFSLTMDCTEDPYNETAVPRCTAEYPDPCKETWDFKNPCTTGNDPNRLTYFQHPYNPKKFLMCDELGKVYVVQCLNCDEIEKMTRTYSIQTTWDGQPITHDPISITVGPFDPTGHLVLTASGPYFNDPGRPPNSTVGETYSGLWDYEVAEAFFLNDQNQYLEVELSPNGMHLLLLLKGQRDMFKDQLPINYHASITGNTWRGVAHIPLEYFPPKVSKFNAYAIHGSGNGRTYESLYPVPTGKYTDPDFHKLNYFQPIDFQQIVPDNWSPNYTSPEWDPIIVLG